MFGFEWRGARNDSRCEVSGAVRAGRNLRLMSANHVDPDMAVEVFVLDGPVPPDGAIADA